MVMGYIEFKCNIIGSVTVSKGVKESVIDTGNEVEAALDLQYVEQK